MAKNKDLVLDFDGVIHAYTGWDGIDQIKNPPVVGAIAFLEDALNYFDVNIYSSRSSHPAGMKAMQDWLHKWAHRSAETDEKGEETSPDWTDEWLGRIKWPISKPAAFATIDDRGILFTGEFPDAEELQYFKPWWQE